jgi:hypothetical protein
MPTAERGPDQQDENPCVAQVEGVASLFVLPGGQPVVIRDDQSIQARPRSARHVDDNLRASKYMPSDYEEIIVR